MAMRPRPHNSVLGVKLTLASLVQNFSFRHHETVAQTGLVRNTRSNYPFFIMLVGSALVACRSEDLPVVSQGRYVEIATARDDTICGGTVPYMDDYLTSVMTLLGTTPPNRIFVRYEWREARGESTESPIINRTTRHGDITIIDADRLLHEHELVHAAHGQAWPASRRFLHEGLAVLLDSQGTHTQSTWPTDAALDPLLEDNVLDNGGYDRAWVLVSQIVLDHGMEGLRELWHAVPSSASAEQVRRAYQNLFGRSIDVLLEPREYYEGGPDTDRWSCYYVICDEPESWDGDVWRADGPFDCADDPDALGPRGSNGTGAVERHYVVELEAATSYRFTASGGAGTYLRPCGLQCLPLGTPALPFFPDTSTSRADLRGGQYRVEILTDFEDLPVDAPSTFQIERLE